MSDSPRHLRLCHQPNVPPCSSWPEKAAGPVPVAGDRACVVCSRSEPKESRTRGSRPSDSPSTALRLRHLAGVYCLDSRDHRPFVLEFPASTGQPVPASSRAFQFVAYVPATHIGNHFQIDTSRQEKSDGNGNFHQIPGLNENPAGPRIVRKFLTAMRLPTVMDLLLRYYELECLQIRVRIRNVWRNHESPPRQTRELPGAMLLLAVLVPVLFKVSPRCEFLS